MEILREPTKAEITGDVTDESSQAFVPIALPSGRVKTVKDRFNKRINQEEQKAMSQGKPFAVWAIRADIKDLQDEFNKRWKRQGYIKGFKIPTLNEIKWDKYSNVKNWELLEESAKHDPYYLKYIDYKYL